MESDASKCLSSDQSRNWLELPPEVTAVILNKVGAVDILINAHRVCTSWHSICKDPSMWRSIDMQLGTVCDSWFEVDFEAMARHAVDRSCGQLVDISVAQFATDGFIHYIAQSSRQISRLQIVSCHALSEDLLKETASKFPMLEELKVQSTQFSVAAVEAVGRCCPQLKTFKCNVFGYVPLQAQDDDLAYMIAKTMPQLCHLQLLKTKITNTGLKVILDGCPCLETLDLRGCYLVNPKVDNIVEVCSARFMKVRFPAEPIEPGEYQGAEPDDDWYSDGSFDAHSLDFSGHFDEPSDFDDPFYDDDGVDYDDLFSNLDNEEEDPVGEEEQEAILGMEEVEEEEEAAAEQDNLFGILEDEEEYPVGEEEQEAILGMEEEEEVEEEEEAAAEQDDLFGNVEDEEEDPVGEEEQEAILGMEEVEEEEEAAAAAAEQETEEEDGFEIDEEENLNDGGDDYWNDYYDEEDD